MTCWVCCAERQPPPQLFGATGASGGPPGNAAGLNITARQIIDACRHGDPELTITLQARLAAMANAVAPSAVAVGMMLAAQALPGPAGSDGDRQKRGRESESRLAPSFLTTLSTRAAQDNNEL